MAIKTEVTLCKHSQVYPLLRQSARSGMVVLFTSSNKGVVLAAGNEDDFAVGDTSSTWTDPGAAHIWKPVKSVTLTMTED